MNAFATGLLAQTTPRARNLFFDVEGSTVAREIDNVFYFILWVSIISFVGIVAATVWFLVKYRSREGHTSTPTATHDTKLEITWTVIPTILSAAMFWVGFDGFMDLKEAPADSYEIQVNAMQWSWSFTYPNGATTNDLHVPAGKPVKLVMTSSDVLHSLFIPAFRVKQDVVPGRYTSLWFQSLEPEQIDPEGVAEDGYATVNLFCTEYCGTDHSNMNRLVHIYEPEEFTRVIDEFANFMADPAIPLATKGERIYTMACTSCHLKTTETKIGPGFELLATALRDRTPLEFEAAEALVPDEDYIRESILDPAAKVRKGYPNQMNSFQGQLTDLKITALIAYIKTLADAQPAQ